MQNKWQSGMSNRSNIYSFGFQFRSCFLLTVMKMSRWFQSTTTTTTGNNRPPTKHHPTAESAAAGPLLHTDYIGTYDVVPPVNDLAIAVVFFMSDTYVLVPFVAKPDDHVLRLLSGQ